MASVRLGREDVSKIRVKVYKKEKGRILRMKESRMIQKKKKEKKKKVRALQKIKKTGNPRICRMG